MSMALHIVVALRVNQLIPSQTCAADWIHHRHTQPTVVVVTVVNDRHFKVIVTKL